MKLRSFKKAIEKKTQLGFCIMYPAPGIIERVGVDWDWIWVDGQHGQLGYQDQLAIVRACNLLDRHAFLRVPGHEFGLIGKALDCAPTGVIVPCVDTPAQANALVDAVKFPPLGKRSYGGRRPIDLYGRTYSDNANEDIILICQIESPEAIENAEAIAAVDGVDALFLGPDDVMLRRGLSMVEPRSKDTLGADMERVIHACNKHGKIGCMVGFGDEMMKLCLSMGYRMVVGGGDVALLANGSKAAAAAARAIVDGSPPQVTRLTEGIGSPY